MRIPPYAEGTLSDYLEQRIDALELFVIDKFGLEDTAHLNEIIETRAVYRLSIDALCEDAPEDVPADEEDEDDDLFTPAEDDEPFLDY